MNTQSNQMEWLNEIELEEIVTGDAKLVLDQCGEDVLRALLDKLGSVQIYIPKSIIYDAKRAYIINHFNGQNQKQLAVKLEVSEKFVRDTVNHHRLERLQRHERDLFSSQES